MSPRIRPSRTVPTRRELEAAFTNDWARGAVLGSFDVLTWIALPVCFALGVDSFVRAQGAVVGVVAFYAFLGFPVWLRRRFVRYAGRDRADDAWVPALVFLGLGWSLVVVFSLGWSP